MQMNSKDKQIAGLSAELCNKNNEVETYCNKISRMETDLVQRSKKHEEQLLNAKLANEEMELSIHNLTQKFSNYDILKNQAKKLKEMQSENLENELKIVELAEKL